MKSLLPLALCLCLTARADMGFLNSTTNYLQVAGPAMSFVLPPSASFLLPPADGDTNTVQVSIFGGAALSPLVLQDGVLYSFNPDGSISSSAFLQSSSQDDADLASYFMNGLEVGSGLAAVLLGFIAVRRALSLGDNWND